jgi:hypothetical protein
VCRFTHSKSSNRPINPSQIICCAVQLTTQPVCAGCHDGFHCHFPNERSFTMFWIFLLLTSIAALLIKLGAASVMVSVLSIGLKAAVTAIAILATLLLWMKLSKQKKDGNAI